MVFSISISRGQVSVFSSSSSAIRKGAEIRINNIESMIFLYIRDGVLGVKIVINSDQSR